jgi:hypothetical protein
MPAPFLFPPGPTLQIADSAFSVSAVRSQFSAYSPVPKEITMTRITNDKITPRPKPNERARVPSEIRPPDPATGESAGGDGVLIGIDLDGWEEGSPRRGDARACAILEVSVGTARYLSRLIERDLARKRGHRRRGAAHERAQSLRMFLRDCVDEFVDDDRERRWMRRRIRRDR